MAPGRTIPIAATAAALLAASAPAAAQCLLCPPAPNPPSNTRSEAPLAIEIASGLDFDRVAVTAPTGGSVAIDPTSRARTITGGLAALGGLSMVGNVTVRGEPGRAVRIDLPDNVLLIAADGSSARISRFVTDLPAAPRLGPDGILRFAFGGRLDVSGDADGDYRGRIAITVDYQ